MLIFAGEDKKVTHFLGGPSFYPLFSLFKSKIYREDKNVINKFHEKLIEF